MITRCLRPHTTPDRKELDRAWEEFSRTGDTMNVVVRPEVLESWKRCRIHGIDPEATFMETDYKDEQKQSILKKNSTLKMIARPLIVDLYKVIESMEVVIFLTDKTGFILDAVGDGMIWRACQIANIGVGGTLSEEVFGTNSVALALRYDKPFQMMPGEQYVKAARIITCAASPVHGEQNSIIGCLAITGHQDIVLRHPHTLGMITTAAQVIENQLRLRKESIYSYLTSEYLRASMEEIPSGLFILDKNNDIKHINSSAEKIWGGSLILGHKIESYIKNTHLLSVIKEDRELHDYELIFHESSRSPRCLVTLKNIIGVQGDRMGKVLCIQEIKSVQGLARKVVGFQVRYTFDDIKGKSPQIKTAIRLGMAAVKSSSNILLVGESGTGKEMFAQAIHNASDHSGGPFVGINCAAIPHDLIESELFGYEAGTFTGGARCGKSGKFELAEGGTLFLDEINGMSLSMQAKLLRVLEEKRFFRLGGTQYFSPDVRIIAATNQDLLQAITSGSFRSDLYYRLNVLEITIPPLRERRGDVRYLAPIFVEKISRDLGKDVSRITPEALDYLENLPWNGNVRELKNWIERAINLTEHPLLTIRDFSWHTPRSVPALTSKRTLSKMKRLEIESMIEVLEQCEGNVSECCKVLGIGRATFYRRMKKHHLLIERKIQSGQLSPIDTIVS